MTYEITSETELKMALGECRDKDTFYTPEGALIRITEPIIVSKKLIFNKLKFRVMFHQITSPSNHDGAFIITRGLEVVGSKCMGRRKANPTTWNQDGLQTLFKVDGASYFIDNNSVYEDSNYAAIWLFDCEMTRLERTVVRNCCTYKVGYGFGYGVWQGGKGNAYNQVLMLSNCNMSNNRHSVGSSEHPNDIYVLNSTFSAGEYCQQILDRHGDGTGRGGGSYYIIGNTFNNPINYAFELAYPHDISCDQVKIYDNTFARSFGRNGTISGKKENEFEDQSIFRNNIYP